MIYFAWWLVGLIMGFIIGMCVLFSSFFTDEYKDAIKKIDETKISNRKG